MKSTQIFIKYWCLVTLAVSVHGAVHRYPDGTVSPYPPRFFGVGLLTPFDQTIASGVAAEGGTIRAVTVTAANNSGFGFQACVYQPGIGQLVPLADPHDGATSVVYAISADGRIKVGSSEGNPCYWDANGNFAILHGETEGFTAELDSVLAITNFFPPRGLPGCSVTILGNRFTGAATVSFNGTAANFVDDSDHRITATVPVGATTGPISITNSTHIASSGSGFTVLADSDGDQMPDDFEQQYFSSPTAGDPAADGDGDGQTTLQEFLAGTDPLDSGSVFRIVEIRRQGNDLVIVFQARAGIRYRVEAGATMADGFPFPIADLPPSTSDMVREVIESDGATQPKRFYRVRVLR